LRIVFDKGRISKEGFFKMNSDKQQKFSFALLGRALSYARPYKWMFGFATSSAIVFALISPLRPWLTQYTLDCFIVNPDKNMLLSMSLLMVGVLFLETLFQFLTEYLAGWLGQTIVRDMRTKLFKHISHLHLQYFDKTPIGTLVTRVVSDMEAISDIFSEGLLVILGDMLKLIMIISVMFFTNWKLALISLSVFPVLIIGANMFKNAVNKSFNDVRTQIAKLNAFVQEHITGMSVVQIFNREEVELEKFKYINAQHRDANIRSIWYYSVFFPVIEILSSVSIGLIIWWGGGGVFDQTFSVGQLVAFIMYITLMFRPIRLIADRFNTLQMGIVASDRVFKVMDTPNPMNDFKGQKLDGISLKGDLEFKNVSFAYEKDNYVLKNISFKARKGETIALVGATGAGKSSIASLVNRFYEYNNGEILIDGISVRDYELSFLRKNIGIVLQDVFLYSDTIANNISLSNTKMKREEIIAAAKIIGAHDFIMRLPGNYDYDVMERGATLSVGQRQLISFIRAYLYNPAILIMDEATSSIDTESEMLIQRATELVTKQRTSIVIAHRLATILRADKILVLDKGEIIESGTHQELLALNLHYRKLYELQFVKELE
jgi:ATP-binding cassette, subfamily B, multidrug efflux pump